MPDGIMLVCTQIGACLCVLEGHTGMVVCCDWIHGYVCIHAVCFFKNESIPLCLSDPKI